MNTPTPEEAAMSVIRYNRDLMQMMFNLGAGKSMFDKIFNPEPQLEHFSDRATFQDAHDKWERERRDNLAEQTTDGCCGECE